MGYSVLYTFVQTENQPFSRHSANVYLRTDIV